MTVGEHTVTVYTDPGAGGWSAPIASNPYLTDNLDGWREGPFGTPWTWHPDGTASGSLGMNRSEAYPVARTPASAYRVRATITLDRACQVSWGLFYGRTPSAAWSGPYWSPGDAAEHLSWGAFTAGTHTVEASFDPTSIDPALVYLGPFIYVWGDSPPPFRITTLELMQRTAPSVDLSCLVDEVSINHGRDDSGSQPEASSATITLTSDPADPLPVEVDVGASLVVSTTTERGTVERFVGRITDVSLGWEEAGPDTPDAGIGQIVAVGPLGDLGRRVVGDVPWPTELDGARVARVVAAAGLTLDPLTSDPGTVQILARDIDSTPALDAARDAATSASGVLWETRAGEIRYADADHRRGTPSGLTLDACDLLVSPTWRRTTEGLVNAVSVGYGVTPEGGEQPRYVEESAASVARWGRYAYSVETDLAALADAQGIGRLLLARNSSPVWIMAALPVDVAGLDEDQYAALLGLDLHGLVTLTGLPAIGTAPTTASLWVEGWRETLTYGGHEIDLVVSGYCRTAPPPRWDDVNPAWLWGGTTRTLARTNLSTSPIADGTWGPGWRLNAAGAQTITKGVPPPIPHPLGIPTTCRSVVATSAGTAEALSLYSIDGDNVPTATSRGIGVWVLAPWASDVILYVTNDLSGTQTTQRIPPNVWSYVKTKAPGTGLTVLIVNRRDGLMTSAGDTVYATGSIAEAGMTPGPYFDGDTADTTSTDYAWTGQRAATASTATALTTIPGGLPPDLTWDAAACLGPPANLGRWTDQPATLRWDAIAPAKTWDTYTAATSSSMGG